MTVRAPVGRLLYTRCPSPSASSVALATGHLEAAFAGTGVELMSLSDAGERSVRRSHFTQEQETQFRHGGIVPPLWAAARGAPIALLGIGEVPRMQALLTLGDSTLRAPEDVRGARVALPRRPKEPVDFWRAQTYRGICEALAVADLQPDDVRWVDLATDEPFHADGDRPAGAGLWTAREAARLQRTEVMALVRREVDVIYTYAPAGLGLIEMLGARTIVRVPPGDVHSSGTGTLSVLTAGRAVLEQTPDAVVLYIATLLRAAQWAHQHPEQALRIFAAEEGVPLQWAADTFSVGAPGGLDLRPALSARLLASLQREADALAAAHFLACAVDVEAWVESWPLEQAKARIAAGHPTDPATPAPRPH